MNPREKYGPCYHLPYCEGICKDAISVPPEETFDTYNALMNHLIIKNNTANCAVTVNFIDKKVWISINDIPAPTEASNESL